MASFEIQKFQGGKWVVDSIFDDQVLAIDAAKGIMGGKRAPAAIRVVEESEAGGAPRVLFRQTSVDEHNNEAARNKAVVRKEVDAARAVRQTEKLAARAATYRTEAGQAAGFLERHRDTAHRLSGRGYRRARSAPPLSALNGIHDITSAHLLDREQLGRRRIIRERRHVVEPAVPTP